MHPKHADRRDLRTAHLGIGAHPPSSACPHDRSGRRHFLGRTEVDILPAGLLPAAARALAAVPPADLTPSRGVVLAYLSRYTPRVAISNSRLLACDGADVAFKYNPSVSRFIFTRRI